MNGDDWWVLMVWPPQEIPVLFRRMAREELELMLGVIYARAQLKSDLELHKLLLIFFILSLQKKNDVHLFFIIIYLDWK